MRGRQRICGEITHGGVILKDCQAHALVGTSMPHRYATQVCHTGTPSSRISGYKYATQVRQAHALVGTSMPHRYATQVRHTDSRKITVK